MYSIEDSKIGPNGVKLPCPKCGNMFPVMPRSPAETFAAMVLVAHDSHAFCKEARRVLKECPHDFKVVIAHDDEELLSSLKAEPVNVVLVDINLPGMFGFEVAAKIKNDKALSHIKVILASSAYEAMVHKPTAQSLLGADDYIGAQHLQDMLVDKVVRLLSGEAPALAVPKPTPKTKAAPPAAVEAATPKAKTPAAPATDSPDHQKARRLARIIVKDIALYNQETIEKGLKGGNVRKLLEKELKEGRDFYVKRVADEIRSTTNYLEDELQNLFKASPAAISSTPPSKTPVETPAVAKTTQPEAKSSVTGADSSDHQKAQRLARTIVSDISLYSQEAIEKGLKDGNVMKYLKRDLKEARDLYVKRVSEEIRLTTNYLGDELQGLFDKKRKELGI